MKVVIVDDDPIYRFSFEKVLKLLNPDLDVCSFEDGELALTFFKQEYQATEEPTMVLLDLNMPVLDGWGFLAAFEALEIDKSKVAIHIVSSSANPADLDRAEESSAVKSYQIKPLNKEAIGALLKA